MVYGGMVYGLWLRGDGLWVVGEVGEVVSDGVWVGVGASYRKENLTVLTVVRLPNMRVPLGIKK